MTKTLIINNLEFAQKQLIINDSFAVFDLKRLAETLAISEVSAKAASIYFELSGDSKQFRYPSLHLHCTDVSMQSGEKPNPFAILKGKY